MTNIERITAVIVDTSSFERANNDFIGIKSKLLPSFFSVIEEKNILLLNHPILEKEMEKHIGDTGLYKSYQKLLSQISNNNDVLTLIGIDKESIDKINGYDLNKEAFNKYKEYYDGKCWLGYSNPEKIFEKYFFNMPPFAATGKKKNEFPDAFVIESIKQYVVEHENDIILIVSNDNDWKNSFENVENIILVDSIEDALKMINGIESILSEEMISQIFTSVYEEILDFAQFNAKYEVYEANEFEFVDELEIDNIEVIEVEEYVIPLKISRESILLKSTVRIKIDGHGEIVDEDRSIWDSEDNEYLILEYSDMSFTDGIAEVECEIEIKFDFDDLENSSTLEKLKFINQGNIDVKTDFVDIKALNEDELALRHLREDFRK